MDMTNTEATVVGFQSQSHRLHMKTGAWQLDRVYLILAVNDRQYAGVKSIEVIVGNGQHTEMQYTTK